MAGRSAGVETQPGAQIGQRTYCPVSGVAFEVKQASARRIVGSTTFFFCCESCATYFSAHQDAVLAARHM